MTAFIAPCYEGPIFLGHKWPAAVRRTRDGQSTTTVDSEELVIIAEQSKKRPEEHVRELYEVASVASVGLEMGLAVTLGWFMGHWLDGKLGTDPYLMLVFLMCGVAAGFKGVLRVARQAKRADAGAGDEE